MRFLHERPISLKVGFHVRRDDYQLLSRFVSAMHMSMRTFFTTKKQGGPVVASIRQLLRQMGKEQNAVAKWIENSLEVQKAYPSLIGESNWSVCSHLPSNH